MGLNFYRVLISLIGIGVSLYAYHVEIHAVADEHFKAACDLSETISCSKVFTSRWGKGFGLVGPFLGEEHELNLPNSLFGILFYTLTIVGGMLSGLPLVPYALFVASVTSIAGSVYLAYILAFVLNDFCIVCVSTYVLNAALFVINYRGLRTNGQKEKSS